jgi:membrane-bound lytic murein transglycosylase D
VSGQTSLQLVADCAGSTLDQIQSLNPQFSLQTTSPNISQNVYVPVGSGLQATAALQTVPVDKRVTWRVHHYRDGESLNDVASAYQVSVDDLRSSNQLNGDQLKAGAVLNIPVKAKTIYIPAPTRSTRNIAVVRRYGKRPVVAKRNARSAKRRRR